MRLRRFVTFLPTIVLLPLLAQSVSAAHRFADVPDNAWFTAYTEQAVDLGIVSGYQDGYGRPTGTFGPERAVTVAEALKISLLSAGYDVNRGIGYGHWAARYLSIATGENFEITHVQNLNVDRAANRAEVASMFADAFRLQRNSAQGNVFTDVTVATPYASAIEALAKDRIVSGDTDTSGNPTGRYRPMAAINRAETVKIAMEARGIYGTPGFQYSSFSSSSSSSRSSSSRSSGHCSLQDCGTAPGMPNWQCPDGSVGGPSCERLSDTSNPLSAGGRCGWLIRQCPVSSSRSSSSSSIAGQTFTMNYTNNGFQPSFIAIRVGDIVKFRNDADTALWVASNPHPTHSEYPELDMHASMSKGGEFSFKFDRTGTWGFHNHLRTSHQAVVSVDPR